MDTLILGTAVWDGKSPSITPAARAKILLPHSTTQTIIAVRIPTTVDGNYGPEVCFTIVIPIAIAKWWESKDRTFLCTAHPSPTPLIPPPQRDSA